MSFSRCVVVASLLALGYVEVATATSLCSATDGTLKVRDVCQKSEVRIEPASLGLQGTPGAQGATGPPGPRGPMGVPGPPSTTPLLTGIIQNFIGGGLGALVGALVGAWGAFRFERRRRRLDERTARVAGVRKALFTLAIQRSFIENLSMLYLDPHRSSSRRWRTLPKYLAIPIHEELNLDSLSFLLELRASELLGQLAHGQNQFRKLLGVLEARSVAYQAMLDRLTEIRKSNPVAAGEAYLGPEVEDPLQGLTDALYEAADFARSANEEDIDRIRDFFGESFPGEHIPEVWVRPATASN